jgi:hypothetical protein
MQVGRTLQFWLWDCERERESEQASCRLSRRGTAAHTAISGVFVFGVVTGGCADLFVVCENLKLGHTLVEEEEQRDRETESKRIERRRKKKRQI